MANLNMLDILVRSTGAQESTRDLDALAVAGNRAEGATLRMGNALGTASNRAKTYQGQVQKAGMHTTNLTWQLNDIGVMLASGQNPFMLAMQQGTQITQIFSQMGGTGRQAFDGIKAAVRQLVTPLNLMTIGAIAGGAALLYWGVNALKAGGSADSLEDSLKTVNDKLGEYTDLISSQEGLGSKLFADAQDNIENTSKAYSDLIALAKLDAFQSIIALNADLAASATNSAWLTGQIGDAGNLLEIETQLQGNITAFKNNRQAVADFISELDGLRTAVGLQDQYDQAVKIREEFIAITGPIGQMSEEQRVFMRNLSDTIFQMELLGAASDANANSIGAANLAFVEQIEKSIKAATERLEAEKEMTTDLQQRARLQSALNNLGADSVGYLREQAAVERQIFEAELDQLKITGQRKAALLAQFDALKAIEETTFNIEAAKTASDAAAKDLKEIQDISAELKEQVGLQRVLNTYGEESLQYRSAALQASQDALEAELRLANATQTQIDNILKLNETWWLMSNPIDQAIERTRGLTSMISGANTQAMALVRNLGMVPSAMAGLGNDVVAQVAAMRQANASLTDQIQNGTDARVAAVRAERDAILNRMEVDGVDMVAQTARIATMDREIETLEALAAQNNALTGELDDMNEAASDAAKAGVKALSDEAKAATKSLEELDNAMLQALDDARTPLEVFNDGLAELAELADYAASKGVNFGRAYNVALRGLQEELSDSIPLVSDLSDAFDNWVDRGFSDFDGMLDDMFDAFKSFIANMIITAAKNKIMVQLGMSGGGGGMGGGSALMGGLSAGAGAGGVGALTGLGALGAGAGAAGSALLAGGPSMMMASIGGQVAAAGAATAGMGATLAAVGAVALPLLAIAAVFAFFSSKTKIIDSGIQATVDMENAMFKSFEEIEKSRFFGLSKKRSTSTQTLTGEDSAPFDTAAFVLRESIIGATESLGVSVDTFDNWSYKFKLSLKGLDEAAQASAINDEFARMGDSLASLVPHIANMNHLFEVAANRVSLTDRLLQAQGKTDELTARIRQREMDATNELNKGLLAQVFAAEDAASRLSQSQRTLADFSFTTAAEELFAATSDGSRFDTQQLQDSDDMKELLRELIVAIRSGNVNTARLLTEQLATAERDQLNPEVVT